MYNKDTIVGTGAQGAEMVGMREFPGQNQMVLNFLPTTKCVLLFTQFNIMTYSLLQSFDLRGMNNTFPWISHHPRVTTHGRTLNHGKSSSRCFTPGIPIYWISNYSMKIILESNIRIKEGSKTYYLVALVKTNRVEVSQLGFICNS